MLFVGPWFFAALVALVALYYAPPLRRWQPELLLVASLAWYLAGAGRGMTVLLIASATINAVASWRVACAPRDHRRRLWAVTGVIINLLVLGWFKYGAWALSAPLFAARFSLPLWVLPVGISFYTFHGISLLVDVWRGRWVPPASGAAHARDTLLYLVFFPQLVAGPLVRARFFLPQIRTHRWSELRWRPIVSALIAGYFFKLVVADHLHAITVALDAPDFGGVPAANLATLVVAFSAQLFADFAGYSLIAIGLARLFGYLLPANFDHPYTATSLRDFWRRWHRSLSLWLRDYLYIPLGGKSGSRVSIAARLILVFALGGLWHGAAWGFVLWGLWHGLFVALERVASPRRRVPPVLGLVATQIVVLVGWLLFRIPDGDRLWSFARAFAAGLTVAPSVLPIVMTMLFALPVGLHHLLPRLARRTEARLIPWIEGAMLAAIVLDSAVPAPFVYFQF